MPKLARRCRRAPGPPPPRLPQAPAGVFRGDGEGLVEALIAACERKPVARTAIPELFGRELVPWTDDGSAGAPLGQPLEGAAR